MAHGCYSLPFSQEFFFPVLFFGLRLLPGLPGPLLEEACSPTMVAPPFLCRRGRFRLFSGVRSGH